VARCCAYRPYLRAGFCIGTRTFLSAAGLAAFVCTEMRVSPLLTCGLLQWNADIPVRSRASAEAYLIFPDPNIYH
ncbi:MAG: hypothetical protein ACRD6X_21185, partial [Pyrinomonadaceae bacterium]